MGSATQTPSYQAVNGNIQNDGTADSPRGFASITSTGTFTVTKTGASLYRVAVTSPAAPITATLPTDVKAGYRVRFEVELTSSTETNCFFTSPAIALAQINGTGFVELMALQDNPTTAGHWVVLDVNERTTLAGQTYTFSNGGTITNKTLICSRSKVFAGVDIEPGSATGSASNSGYLQLPIPGRFLSLDGWAPCHVTDNVTYSWGMINVAQGRVYPALGGGLFGTTGTNGFTFGPKVTWTLA